MSETEIKAYLELQNLKISVESDSNLSIKNKYNIAQNNLIEAGCSHRHIAASFPTYKTLKGALFNRKAKKNPRQAKVISEILLEGEYTQTTSKKEFLRYRLNSATNSIFMFACNDSLRILSESKQYFMDGTFTTAPSGFLQLFTIHALITNEVLPLVYILAQRNVYEFIWRTQKIGYFGGFCLKPRGHYG